MNAPASTPRYPYLINALARARCALLDAAGVPSPRRDESPYAPMPPDAVCSESTDDVVAVVLLAAAHRIPVIPYGVGSSSRSLLACTAVSRST